MIVFVLSMFIREKAEASVTWHLKHLQAAGRIHLSVFASVCLSCMKAGGPNLQLLSLQLPVCLCQFVCCLKSDRKWNPALHKQCQSLFKGDVCQVDRVNFFESQHHFQLNDFNFNFYFFIVLQCPHLYICIVCMYIWLNCIYLYLNVYCQCLMLTVCTKGLRVTQFQFSVCMYCTCGRIDNKTYLTWLDLTKHYFVF